MADGYGGPLLSLVLCGCFVDVSVSPDGESENAASPTGPSAAGTSGDSQGSGSSSGETTGCAPNEACLPDAGDAWLGPVLVVMDDQEPPLCGVAAIEVWRGGLDPRTPNCDCSSCGHADSACALDVGFGNTDCSALLVFELSPGETRCMSGEPAENTTDVRVVSSTKCEPPAPPQGGFDRYVVACEILPSGTCEGGLCATQPPSPAVDTCLWQKGAHECPAGLERTLFFTELGGEVSCETCECQAGPDAACSSANVQWFADSTCTDLMDAAAVDLQKDDCVALEFPPGAVMAYGVTADFGGACTSSVGSAPPRGRYEGVDPITACCA